MNKGRFEAGMVIPTQSSRPSTKMTGAVLVVAVSKDRSTIWLADAKKPKSAKGPRRYDIIWDETTGEKIVVFPDCLQKAFRVFRADMATWRMKVPQELTARVAARVRMTTTSR